MTAVALTTGIVSVATAGGASVGAVQAATGHTPQHATIQLAASAVHKVTTDQAPQVLQIAEYKPIDDYRGQIATVLKFAEQRQEADRLARIPRAIRPAEGTFTSPFGARWGTVHQGIDIANVLGTPIVAALDGVVISAGPASGFGNWVRILHDDGTITVYGHMESIGVTVGQQVTAGEEIAKMGSRGFSFGSHLHFEVHPNGGAAIDPIPWLAEHGVIIE